MNPKFIARLEQAFPESHYPGAVVKICNLIAGRTEPEEYESVQELVRRSYGQPTRIFMKLTAMNEILGGFGIEGISNPEDFTSRYGDMDYVNFGDAYVSTIVFDYLKWRWRVMSWGDWIEEAEHEGRVYN